MLAVATAGCGFSAQNPGDGLGPSTVGFLSSTSLQDEASGTVMVPISLDAPADELVLVHYRFSGGTAKNGDDYQGSDNAISIPPGALDAKIPVTILADGLEEPSETIEITLADPTNAVLGASKHTITINSDILPRVGFTTPTSMGDETSSPDLVLSLDIDPPGEVSVDYVVSGTATAGADFTLAQGTVVFPPGTKSKTIALPITDDALDEFDENVLVTLTSSSKVVVGPMASHDHEILDNDLPPVAAFQVAQQAKAENGNTVEVVVQLSAPSGKPISIDVVPGTAPVIAATKDVDFTLPATATLTFAPGETTKTFAVTLTNDTIDEFDEGLALVLANPVNVTASTGADQITITDDDPLPTVSITTASQFVNEGDANTDYPYVVTLDAASAKPIEVQFVFTGTNASTPSDYVVVGAPVQIAPGSTTGTLTIRVIGDNIRETNSNGTEDVVISIAPNASLTNCVRGGTSRTLTIRDDD